MTAPVFEEFDPASDCDCPGCVHRRRVSPRPLPGRFGGHPAARGIVIVAAATSAALGAAPAATAAVRSPSGPDSPDAPGHQDGRGAQAVPVDPEPATPQGRRSPLHGRGGEPAAPGDVETPATTRAEIINRAKVWVAAQVPYSMDEYWSDGYRQDCSGYVSMAWGLSGNEWTGSLDQFGVRITKEELEPGDILLYHNPDNPESGSHVVIFGGWTDYTHTYYLVYEQTPPHTRSRPTPYPYWSNADKYVPYRYKGVTPEKVRAMAGTGAVAGSAGPSGQPASHGVSGYPGRNLFRPGAENPYVAQLGRRLVEKGFGRFYATAPGPSWSEADRRAVEAFQRTQGWRGGAADGYPGPETWRRLFS